MDIVVQRALLSECGIKRSFEYGPFSVLSTRRCEREAANRSEASQHLSLPSGTPPPPPAFDVQFQSLRYREEPLIEGSLRLQHEHHAWAGAILGRVFYKRSTDKRSARDSSV